MRLVKLSVELEIKIMGKKIEKKGWLYEYEAVAEYRKSYDCELTDVRYILGEQFNPAIEKVLICIGVNPSMALPNHLDPTLKRVQKYAKDSGEYGSWYMLNIYPQRATNPNNMDTDDTYRLELHLHNLTAIKNLLSNVKEADVWCAWGAIIDDSKRIFLSTLLFGDESQGIEGLISLFSEKYYFKAYGATKKGYPKHPLLSGKEAKLKSLEEVGLCSLLEKINITIKG